MRIAIADSDAAVWRGEVIECAGERVGLRPLLVRAAVEIAQKFTGLFVGRVMKEGAIEVFLCEIHLVAFLEQAAKVFECTFGIVQKSKIFGNVREPKEYVACRTRLGKLPP
jgi:hypothetical protein